MTTPTLDLDVAALQELPEADGFAPDELADVELRPCGGRTCFFTCLWSCDVTE